MITRSTRLWIFAITVVVVLFSALGIYYLTEIEISNKVHERVIDYEALNLRIIIRAKALGIGGNSEINISEHAYDKRTALVGGVGRELLQFRGVADLYYKKENESTLVVYVSSDGIPRDQYIDSTKLRIVVNELKTYDDLKDYRNKYKAYGLSRISIYDSP